MSDRDRPSQPDGFEQRLEQTNRRRAQYLEALFSSDVDEDAFYEYITTVSGGAKEIEKKANGTKLIQDLARHVKYQLIPLLGDKLEELMSRLTFERGTDRYALTTYYEEDVTLQASLSKLKTFVLVWYYLLQNVDDSGDDSVVTRIEKQVTYLIALSYVGQTTIPPAYINAVRAYAGSPVKKIFDELEEEGDKNEDAEVLREATQTGADPLVAVADKYAEREAVKEDESSEHEKTRQLGDVYLPPEIVNHLLDPTDSPVDIL